MMGYTDGMNGAAWPNVFKDPLGNNNRAGFYISQARLNGNVALDSTFSVTAVWNAMAMDLQEVYLTKRWNDYILRAGKFRGAGLKSVTDEDEFGRNLVNAPRYARLWSYWARTFAGRDFGVEIERDFRAGGIRNRLFIRNANGENVINDEPSFLGGRVTQVLGIDYALDWRISPFTVWGGHIGMLADRSWDQFVGSHEGWKAQYWFKSNAVADGSLNHSLDMGRVHLFNEALLMYLRDVPHPSDSAATQLWGGSSLIRFDHSDRWSSVFRYEFTDPSDGTYPQDGLHMFTLGAIYHPRPSEHPGMKVTAEYVRSYGEQLQHFVSDDVVNCQFQMTF
ncbi:MAG: hypothetical protein JF616_05985 [Fibrobacteres bacterium]|nr:hypothetical protein [Fibrobacterota bacterium]